MAIATRGVSRRATRHVRPLTRRYAAAVGLLISGWHSAAAVARACHSGSGNAVVRDLRRAGWRVIGRWVDRTGEGPGRHHKLFHIPTGGEGQLDLPYRSDYDGIA